MMRVAMRGLIRRNIPLSDNVKGILGLGLAVSLCGVARLGDGLAGRLLVCRLVCLGGFATGAENPLTVVSMPIMPRLG